MIIPQAHSAQRNVAMRFFYMSVHRCSALEQAVSFAGPGLQLWSAACLAMFEALLSCPGRPDMTSNYYADGVSFWHLWPVLYTA